MEVLGVRKRSLSTNHQNQTGGISVFYATRFSNYPDNILLHSHIVVWTSLLLNIFVLIFAYIFLLHGLNLSGMTLDLMNSSSLYRHKLC